MSKFLRFLAWTLFITGVLIGILRFTVIRWWRVPTDDPYLEASVAPSLRGGDWIILWRGTAPIEGNLVVCPEPKAPNRQVVGRIVGESIDHVKVGPEGLQVNRRSFENERSCDKFTINDPGSGQSVEQTCGREIVGSVTHLRGDTSQNLPAPGAAEVDVPADHVFLVSDNREFPWDSRDFGTVPRDTCTEAVIFRLVSKDGFFDVANRLMLVR